MADDKRPLKVFLCHASADKPKVRELYRYLKKRGIQPWLDAEDLLPGQNWQVEIPKALECSDAIIICLSKGSVDKEGYAQKEIKFALDRALEMPEGRIFIIPARLDECEVPRSLDSYQWVDLFGENGYEKLIKSLKLRVAQLQRSNMEFQQVEESDLDSTEKPLENVDEQEIRIFYDLPSHYEQDIPNANAGTVAKNLLEAITRTTWLTEIPDPKDENSAIQYSTEKAEYYDPKEGKTLQYALIIHGTKLILVGKKYADKLGGRSGEAWKPVDEMLIITVTQGLNVSKIRFDSDELPNIVFKDFVLRFLQEIGLDVAILSGNGRKSLKKGSRLSKPPHKLKPEYIVAIIGATATILAALIGVLPKFIKPVPESTPTSTTALPISLNPMEDTSWSPYLAPNAQSKINIRTTPGKTGNALLISFTLSKNEWVGISKSLYPGILVGTHALRFSYWGNGAANSVEVKLLYGLNQFGKSAVFSKLLNGITNTPSWTIVDIPYTEFNCWTDTGCPAGKPIDVSQVLSLDFAISNKPGNPTGSGEFVIDDVEALK